MKTRIAAAATLSLGLIAGTTVAAQAETSEGELALDVLENITVAEDDYCTDYDREEYHGGNNWGNSIEGYRDTRDMILARDAEDYSTNDDGAVEVATFTDPYTGDHLEHVLGGDDSLGQPQSIADIEHVVAVGQAHRNGACAWDQEQKNEFYLDEDNLVVVSAEENGEKDDKDITEYPPPHQGVYCEFAAVKVFVKDKWDLTMNPEEHAEIERILNTSDCEGQEAVPAVALTDADYEPGQTHSAAEDADTSDAEAAGENSDILPEGIDWWMVIAAALVLLGIIGVLPKSVGRTARRATRR